MATVETLANPESRLAKDRSFYRSSNPKSKLTFCLCFYSYIKSFRIASLIKVSEIFH